MVELIYTAWIVSNILLIIYFGFASMYFFVFSIASKFYKENRNKAAIVNRNISILIPAYKEDEVIIDTARKAKQYKSARHMIEVYVIADSLKDSTLYFLRKSGINIIEVSFEKSTKAKALNTALKILPSYSEIVIVLDADNIMEEDCVDQLVEVMESGYLVVQGHRTAKNNNTTFAVLDGISEEVNNAIFRKGHRTLGFSSAIIGSGFACETGLLRNLMQKNSAIGGFDKEFELDLLKENITVAYAENAIIYDEKIQKPDAFVNQRRRWLSAQFVFFSKNIKNAVIQLLKRKNYRYFEKVLQYSLPPRILAVGISFIFSLLHIILNTTFAFSNTSIMLMWSGVTVTTGLAIVLTIPSKLINLKLAKSIIMLPKGFFLTLRALLKTKGANKTFIHTQHNINI